MPAPAPRQATPFTGHPEIDIDPDRVVLLQCDIDTFHLHSINFSSEKLYADGVAHHHKYPASATLFLHMADPSLRRNIFRCTSNPHHSFCKQHGMVDHLASSIGASRSGKFTQFYMLPIFTIEKIAREFTTFVRMNKGRYFLGQYASGDANFFCLHHFLYFFGNTSPHADCTTALWTFSTMNLIMQDAISDPDTIAKNIDAVNAI